VPGLLVAGTLIVAVTPLTKPAPARALAKFFPGAVIGGTKL